MAKDLPTGSKKRKAGRRGRPTPLDLEIQAKMMLAAGCSVRRTALSLGLPSATVQGIGERLTPEERRDWREQHRRWAVEELLPQARERMLEALPAAKLWELNTAVGTTIDKLNAFEGQPSQIYGHLVEHRVKIDELGQRLLKALNGPGAEGVSLGGRQEQGQEVIDGEIEESD